MNLGEFNYFLPNDLIATEPAPKRSAAKLLVLNRRTGEIEDSVFNRLTDFLREGDMLVFNDTKVIPARLHGEKDGKLFEVLLVKKIENNIWESWIRPGRKAKRGDTLKFSGRLRARIAGRKEDIFWLEFNRSGREFFDEINKVGQIPLPPYILKKRRQKGDREYQKNDAKSYQTFCAKKPGSAAAPTAGLHFDRLLLARLNKSGVQNTKITLHVGLGTFAPINVEKIEDFKIHSEFFEVSKKTAEILNAAKKNGQRIIAVGTTTVRVLESATDKNGRLKPQKGETGIYIYPGYKFRFIDGMITNFHLPKSSLIILVSAFAGKDETFAAYNHAIQNNYRFYSYGDGMLII